MGAKLTDKQKKFIDEYLIDLNATQAAIRAGYSQKTAFSIGVENLRKPLIQAEIQKRQSDRQSRTNITQDMVLKELASIGFADVIDYAEVVEKSYTDSEGNEKICTDVDIKLTADIPTDKRKAISSIKQGKNGIEVKLNDKIKALELIGKHIGMFKDGNDGDTTEPITIKLVRD